MIWKIRFAEKAVRELEKLDKAIAKRILDYLKLRLAVCENPQQYGKRITGTKETLWRFRVGNYRLISAIDDKILTILVLRIGHRRSIYKDFKK